MAAVTVRVFLTDAFKQGPVARSADTYVEALRSLVEEYPVLKGLILTQDGHLQRTYIYLLNGRSVEFLGKEHAPLADGDTLSVFPPVGGG